MKHKSKRLVRRICGGFIRSTYGGCSGFTLIELLITLAIIATLVGILVPTLSVVRKAAKEVKQRAQLTTIEMALVAFKNDYGDYPPSDQFSHHTNNTDYCGAQKLAEALLGWDLLGFHPKSDWRADGYDGLTPSGPLTYDPAKFRGDATLHERKGPYLELATANAFRLGELFDTIPTTPLDLNRFVICDAFGRKAVKVGTKTVKAGTPVLYYRANTSSKTIIPPALLAERIYNVLDNYDLIALGTDGKSHPLNGPPNPLPSPWDSESLYENFYRYIRDPTATGASLIHWPYRPDSYILISAGADGLYGTEDDIRNFGD